MWAAQVVALNRPEAIRYNAWKRSRLRRCDICTEARRKSSRAWPHLAISTRTIGRLPGGDELGCSLPRSYPNIPGTKTPGLNQIEVKTTSQETWSIPFQR